MLCLGFGLVAYFGLRNFSRMVFALSRSRSQLFSVGAGIMLLVVMFQVVRLEPDQSADSTGEDFVVAPPPFAGTERWDA